MSDVGRKREMRDEEPRFVSFFFCGVCATCFVLIEMRGRTLVFPDFGGRRKIAWSREPGAACSALDVYRAVDRLPLTVLRA